MLSISNWNLINYFNFNTEANSPFSHVKSLQEAVSVLTAPSFSLEEGIKYKEKIRAFLNGPEVTSVELNDALKRMMLWGFVQNPEKTASFLAGIVDLEKVVQLAQNKASTHEMSFNSVGELARGIKEEYPLKEQGSYRRLLKAEWEKFRPMIIYFIPNVLNIFIEVFSFLDDRKKFTSLWDKYILLEIIYKFVLIPFTLIKILTPLLVDATKVYITAATIILGSGFLIAAYQKKFKPLPNDVVNCQNLEKVQTNMKIKYKVGQTAPIGKMVESLIVGLNVAIVGKTGEGKTSLVYQLVQLKKEGKLPKELESLRFFSLNCGDLMGNKTFGHAEMINQTYEDLCPIRDKVLIFFDEIDHLTANPACFHAFKQAFLNNETPFKFIAATTIKGLEKIKELDTDGSFLQRINPIVLEPASDNQCRLVINELIKREAKDLPIDPRAIDAIIEKSKLETYLPHVGRLAKAEKMMRAVIGKCLWTYNERFIPEELAQLKDTYQALESAVQFNKDLQKIVEKRKLRGQIEDAEKILEQQKKQIIKIKECLQKKERFLELFAKATHDLSGLNRNVDKKKQIQYFLKFIYGEEVLHEELQQLINPLKEKFDIEINANLVRRVLEPST